METVKLIVSVVRKGAKIMTVNGLRYEFDLG